MFPRYAISTGFFATLLTMMTTFHGMALYRMLNEHPEGDKMREQWLQTALRSELNASAPKARQSQSLIPIAVLRRWFCKNRFETQMRHMGIALSRRFRLRSRARNTGSKSIPCLLAEIAA